MTDQTQREAIEKAAEEYSQRQLGNANQYLREVCRIDFVSGAFFGLSLERERARVLEEALVQIALPDYAIKSGNLRAETAAEALAKYRGET